MGAFATKSFFKKKLKEFADSGINYFEVGPAPDCCPICEAMANRKIKVATATKDDFPPFHKECRCDILPLDNDQEAGFLKEHKSKYESGEFPMKRCPHCKEWIAGNALKCNKCNKEL
jgi:NAD+--asparagine ADP-ribosyltransferase